MTDQLSTPPPDTTSQNASTSPASTTTPETAAAVESPTRSRALGSVFWISVGVSALFVLWAVLFTDNLNAVTMDARDWVTGNLGWSYLIVTLGILVALVFLAFSPAGDVRLGKPTDRPEFSTIAWICMILSAVMGIGLVSYGVAEPILHLSDPPRGLAQPGTPEAAVRALQYSFFDWGPHAWAVFAMFGLAIAYSTYVKGRPCLVSQLFYPLIGERVNGPIGKAIDILAVFATLFGTTTSLGLGALQINNGAARLFGMPVNSVSQVLIVAAITAAFTMSAVTGVHKGIKLLSQGSAVLAGALFVFILIVGPAAFVANLYVESLGTYVSDFFRMSLQGNAFGDLAWMQWWTYFMLAWWVAWGAFVGVFLARISKGRTIRGFIVGVLVVPTLVFFTWFAVFGGTAINVDLFQNGTIGQQASEDLNSAFFATLENFPLSSITSVIAIILVIAFFVSGADANTYVLSMLTTQGDQNPRTPVLIVWGLITGAAAAVLMLADGLNALQTTVIIASFPFLLIIVGLSVSFFMDLIADRRRDARVAEATAAAPAVVGADRGQDGRHATETRA